MSLYSLVDKIIGETKGINGLQPDTTLISMQRCEHVILNWRL